MIIISHVNWSFQEHEKLGKPWSMWKGQSFPQSSSVVQKSTTFPHGTEHTQSLPLKAVPESDFKAWTYILKISEFQIEQEKSHTHTHTHTHTYKNTKWWYTVPYLVSKFLNFHLLNYNVEQTRSHWTPGKSSALHQFPQSEWEVFFQELLCLPKKWIYSMSVK
jgi:hypothetical protein